MAQLLKQDQPTETPPSRFVDAAQLRGAWSTIRLPYEPRPKLFIGARGPIAVVPPIQVSWFRFAAPSTQDRDAPLYLYIPRWKTDGQIAVYVNERIIYQSHANQQWNGSNMPLWVPLEDTAEAGPPREFLIRMQHLQGIGGSMSSVWVGDYGHLAWRYLTRQFFVAWLPFMSSIAFLATGIFTFFVWIGARRDRRERTYLLFFLMSVAAFIRTMPAYLGMDRLPVSDDWFGWATGDAALWTLTIIHFFLIELHRRPQPWLTRFTVGLTLFWGVVSFPAAPLLDPTLSAPLMYVCVLVMGNVVCLSGIYNSWRAGAMEGVWLAASALIGIELAVYDWLLENNFVNIEGLFVSLYANIAITLVFGYIMLSRYVVALSTVEDAKDYLSQRLKEREAELAQSYEKLRVVEQRELLTEERRRLMQDMHDGMGSSLVTALRGIEHGKMDEAAIVEVLKGCIDDLKLTIDSMEPVETDLLLLLATFRFRLEPRLESMGIRLRWHAEDVPPMAWLDQRNALHIFRIFQECFTNIIKHAGATEIRMTTVMRGETVLITVVDNGKGFSEQVEPSLGKGMANLRSRARAIGAEVGWASTSAGTAFQLCLPVTKDKISSGAPLNYS